MYSDYVNYVKNIRNSLIQNGIEVSDVNDDLNDYRVLFLLGLKLDEVLYYFHVLAVSGSEYMLKDFFLPLNDTYKDRLRNICYDEFITDILPNYKKLLGDEGISDYYEYENSDEDIENEDNDLYSDMFDENVNDNQDNIEENNSYGVENNSYAMKSFLNMVSSVSEDKKYEEVSHGVNLDTLNKVVEPIIKENEVPVNINPIYEEVSKGVNLDELIKEERVFDKVNNSEYEEEYEEVFHGINLDELVEDNSQNDNFSWDDEELEDGSWNEEEPEEGSWGDEGENYDEVEPEEEGSWGDGEEYEEGEWGEDEEEPEEEGEWGEDEEEYEEPEEESPWGDDEVEEGSWGDEEEETSLEEDTSQNIVNEENNVNISNEGNKSVKKDLADNLQELTNKTLTGIKKGMIRLINKENSD